MDSLAENWDLPSGPGGVMPSSLFLSLLEPARETRVACPFYQKNSAEGLRRARDGMPMSTAEQLTTDNRQQATGLSQTTCQRKKMPFWCDVRDSSTTSTVYRASPHSSAPRNGSTNNIRTGLLVSHCFSPFLLPSHFTVLFVSLLVLSCLVLICVSSINPEVNDIFLITNLSSL